MNNCQIVTNLLMLFHKFIYLSQRYIFYLMHRQFVGTDKTTGKKNFLIRLHNFYLFIRETRVSLNASSVCHTYREVCYGLSIRLCFTKSSRSP